MKQDAAYACKDLEHVLKQKGNEVKQDIAYVCKDWEYVLKIEKK